MFNAGNKEICAMAFNTTSDKLIYGGIEQVLYIKDLDKDEEEGQKIGDTEESIWSVCLSNDGKKIFCTGSDKEEKATKTY